MYANILMSTDGSDVARKGVKHGIALANALNVKATIITVTEPLEVNYGGDLGVGWIPSREEFDRFDGKLSGIISKFDFLRVFAFTTGHVVPQYNQLMSQCAGDVMSEAVVSVDPASPLTQVLQLMVSLKIRSFPVMSANGHLQGIISREDIMQALKEATQESQ